MNTNQANDPKLYWIGFNLVRGIGASRLRKLIAEFGDLQSAWQASPVRLQAAGIGPKVLDHLLQVRGQISLEQVWENIQKKNISVITWEDEAYPRRLKEIDQPPPVLYVRGELTPADDWAIAVVGTRRVTAYGRQVAGEIGAALAAQGVTVVSGLARGVDAIAHQAALEAGGRSLAVLGSGVDCIYPSENRRLAERMMLQGGLLSDYPPGTLPEANNFPPRNRIISGLSLAVVIVEAGERSGALITASFAAEQGREVFAVPGNLHAPQSAGTNQLIQKGANPYSSIDDLLEVLDLRVVHEKQAARQSLPVEPLESKLLEILSLEPLHVDEISRQANLPIAQISATLTILELKGLVKGVGGMSYVAAREPRAEYHLD